MVFVDLVRTFGIKIKSNAIHDKIYMLPAILIGIGFNNKLSAIQLEKNYQQINQFYIKFQLTIDLSKVLFLSKVNQITHIQENPLLQKTDLINSLNCPLICPFLTLAITLVPFLLQAVTMSSNQIGCKSKGRDSSQTPEGSELQPQ